MGAYVNPGTKNMEIDIDDEFYDVTNDPNIDPNNLDCGPNDDTDLVHVLLA